MNNADSAIITDLGSARGEQAHSNTSLDLMAVFARNLSQLISTLLLPPQ